VCDIEVTRQKNPSLTLDASNAGKQGYPLVANAIYAGASVGVAFGRNDAPLLFRRSKKWC